MTFHQVNQDGAGPLTAAVDPTSRGTDPAAFQTAQVTQNVLGIGVGGYNHRIPSKGPDASGHDLLGLRRWRKQRLHRPSPGQRSSGSFRRLPSFHSERSGQEASHRVQPWHAPCGPGRLGQA